MSADTVEDAATARLTVVQSTGTQSVTLQYPFISERFTLYHHAKHGYDSANLDVIYGAYSMRSQYIQIVLGQFRLQYREQFQVGGIIQRIGH